MNGTTDHHRLITGLRGLADLEGGRRDLSGVLTRAASLIRDAAGVPYAYAAVSLETASLISCARDGRAVLRTDPWEGPGALAQQVIASGEPLLWKPGQGIAEPSPLDLTGCPVPTDWFAAPLRLTSPATGIVAAMGTEMRPISASAQARIELIASHLDVVVANLLAYQKAEALALTDELTRLYNFRFLKAALRREMERAARYGQVFSIIMVDVDHLKRYNDVHGHLKGSELLRQLAAILSRSSRAIDLVAKYGGDEFMIILPQTRLEGAVTMANRIRAAVAATRFPHAEPGDLTISVGVASFPQHGDSVNNLVAAADEALFRAKRASRNCVVAADAPGSAGGIPEVA